MKPKFTMILTLLALGVQFVFAQQKTVSGTVSDENNMPLPGATVLIAGTSYCINNLNSCEVTLSFVRDPK